MPYERLLISKHIQPYSARPIEIQRLIQVARRDLHTAENNLDEAPDWAYSIAYNALLQASRALMLHEGFRPRGGEPHATVVEFVSERMGEVYRNQVVLFDQMRRKRHRVIYETAGLISKAEAEQAVAFARKFVETLVEQITHQGKLEL